MQIFGIEDLLAKNSYPGRGIAIGRSEDGLCAVFTYFIMGRSQNSRNRVFTESDGGIITEAADEKLLTDPSLIIYAPVKVLGNRLVVTNGDQTDTIIDFLNRGESFENALGTRTFEPDAPNYTPRISGMAEFEGGGFSYKLSILKSNGGRPESALRFFFEYENPVAGEGHFIHTYKGDGNPIPSFEGEPVSVKISGGIDEYAAGVWSALNEDNKVSLFVCYANLESGDAETKIFNKYEKI